jgi:hypothetical protein
LQTESASLEAELSGRIDNICEGGFFITPSIEANAGDRIIAYAEGLARLEGVVVRIDSNGFAVKLNLSEDQKQDLSKRIAAALSGKPYLRILDRRNNKRLILNLDTTYRIIPDGTVFDCTIVDVSSEAVTVETTQIKPAVGENVRVGGFVGRVYRHGPNGFVVMVDSCEHQRYKLHVLLKRIWLASTAESGEGCPPKKSAVG